MTTKAETKAIQKQDEALTARIIETYPTVHGRTLDEAESLVARAKDAADAMDFLANHYKRAWGEADNEIHHGITRMRELRFASESETRQLLASLKDVREFFLDPVHETQLARLAEFVTLLERLRSLQQSGFLELISDTILRLATHEQP